jgi:hypothetical protein
MKRMILIVAGMSMSLLMGSAALMAQDCDAYFVTDEGDFREMKSYDKKDKLTGTIQQKVIEIKEIQGGKSITVRVDSYDKKDELTFSDDLTMTCKDGIFTVDMKNYLNYEMMSGLESISIDIEADNLEMPSDLQPGMELKDGYIKVKATNMGIPILNMEVRIFDRKVEGRENISTPAGSFDCFKLTYTTEVKTMGKFISNTVEWVAMDVGMIRSESYDKNNKLTGYTVLTELKQ